MQSLIVAPFRTIMTSCSSIFTAFDETHYPRFFGKYLDFKHHKHVLIWGISIRVPTCCQSGKRGYGSWTLEFLEVPVAVQEGYYKLVAIIEGSKEPKALKLELSKRCNLPAELCKKKKKKNAICMIKDKR